MIQKKYRWFIYFIGIFLLLQFAGCKTFHRGGGQDGPPPYDVDASCVPDAVPKCEPRSAYGNPRSYTVFGRRYYVMRDSRGYVERGFASWYGTKFHAKRTSSGESYSMLGMTAAHKTLPLPTYAQVTNLKNGRHVIVKINDRGPFHDNRIIDLSYVAAKKLGIMGTGMVEVRAIDPRHYSPQVATVSPSPVDGKSQIYLQMGAFASHENAERLSQQVQDLTSYAVRIKEGSHGDQTVYRVQIGPLASADATDELHNQLRSQGLGDSVTVIQ